MQYIYRFINQEGEVIYIGRTNNLENRLERQHFTKNGHLPQECYAECSKVEYAEVKTANEVRIYEIYYIAKYRPKFNVTYNEEGEMSFKLPELEWFEFERTVEPTHLDYELLKNNRKTVARQIRSLVEIIFNFDTIYDFNNMTKDRLEEIHEAAGILMNLEDRQYQFDFSEQRNKFRNVSRRNTQHNDIRKVVLQCNLQRILDDKGISKNKLAAEIGERRATINDLCANKEMQIRRIPASLIAKLCLHLDISMNELFEII
jgi:excinuclease UvrABC nuclease subunit/DNA-binding Xre family transcriptional regulator